MKKQYVVAIKPQPQTLGERQFDLDALTLLNMLSGMDYDNAAKQALVDIKQIDKPL